MAAVFAIWLIYEICTENLLIGAFGLDKIDVLVYNRKVVLKKAFQNCGEYFKVVGNFRL